MLIPDVRHPDCGVAVELEAPRCSGARLRLKFDFLDLANRILASNVLRNISGPQAQRRLRKMLRSTFEA